MNKNFKLIKEVVDKIVLIKKMALDCRKLPEWCENQGIRSYPSLSIPEPVNIFAPDLENLNKELGKIY